MPGGDPEQGLHLVVVARADDRVRGVGQVPRPGAQQVGRRLAACAEPTRLVVGQHVLGARHRGEIAQDLVGEAAGRQRHRTVGDRAVADREDQLDQAAGGLGERGGPGGIAPPRRVHLGTHMLQCDI
jgi:hypothetical protein